MQVARVSVTLREVSIENLSAVLALSVAPEQQSYVATNAKSIAEAHFHPEAWFRAIFADDEAVGFLMLHDENLRPEPRQRDYYFLWRFMIAHEFQGKGFGRQALELLVSHVRSRPQSRTLLTSCRLGPSGPELFYLKCGFQRTGKVEGEEVELSLSL